jgi:flagellar motor switch protein FliG
VTALAGAQAGELAPAAEFILANMSKRMAEAIREEMQEAGRVRPRDGEAAMTEVVNAIRRLQAAGEITLRRPGEEEDEDAQG